MIRVFLLALVFLLNVGLCSAGKPDWQKQDSGLNEKMIISILVDKQLLAATERAVYASNDNAESWLRLIFLEEGNIKINAIDMADGNNPELYIATTGGLYKVDTNLNQAKRIFKGWGNKKDVTCIKIDNSNLQKIYIGTKAGLFISSDSGRRWKEINYFKNKKINDIAIFNDSFYVAADNGIHKNYTAMDSWKRIFVTEKIDDENTDEIEENAQEPEKSDNLITCIKFDKVNNALYAGSNNGIFISDDYGDIWNKFSSLGLTNTYIEDMLLHNNHIITATKKGVFLTDNKAQGEWQALNGLSYRINKLTFDEKTNCLYAATPEGIYKYCFSEKNNSSSPQGNKYADLIKSQLDNEPGIKQIQKSAIEYAEVSPDKIIKMRKAAKNKAWMPKVSVGFDYDGNNNIDIDRGGTNDADVFVVGPEDKKWGWGVDLNWDLGELVWNQDQTSIDVRSRLMVQLRDDILTEITGLYFERKRLQMDIMNKKSDDAILDAQMLRLQELTARIDALTGGYLSGGSYGQEGKIAKR